jgi:hypothetical protein
MKMMSFTLGDRFFMPSLVLISAFFIFLNIRHPAFLDFLCREDGIVENSQAIFYFLSASIMFSVFRRTKYKNKWYFIFFLMFFFVFGEEISWGQRIFGIKTPTMLTVVNVQKEINIHNLNGIHQHIRMAAGILIAYFIYFIPFTNSQKQFKEMYEKFSVPMVPAKVSLLATAAMLFMAVPRIVYHLKEFRTDEIGELFLSIAFFIFAISQLRNNRRTMFFKNQ